jgi:uncharacterized repeat protein (TIGR02059 family)
MKKILILCFVSITLSPLIAQIPLTIEGTVVNNTETGTWGGVYIERSVPTAFIYRNNSITSVNVTSYMLQAGDDEFLSTHDNLDGEIITGNKLTWNGADIASTITHGIFTGYNINALIKYNYLNKVPMAIIRKSNGMTNTAGGVAYNIVNRTGATAVAVKGMSGVLIYNNTFYSDEIVYTAANQPGTWRGLIDIYTNTDVTPNGSSTGTKIKNNIFYTKNQIYNIYIYDAACLNGFESDYNIFYCEAGTPVFNYLGSIKTFAQWQALGFDTHSKVINPNFKNFTDFVPDTRLDYGTNLGTMWQTGLSTNAVWNVGSAPLTTDQNGTWQVGARIYGTTVANPVYLSSVVQNASPTVLEMTFSLNLANIIPSASAFLVQVNSSARTVNAVTVTGTTVQLTLASSVNYGDIITVAYSRPATNPLQTAAGSFVASISAQSVLNNLISTNKDTPPVTITMTVSPNHIHKILNILLAYSGAPTSVLSPEIIMISDQSGNLFLEKLIVTGVTNIRIPLNLASGIYNVLMQAGGQQMASQRMIVY